MKPDNFPHVLYHDRPVGIHTCVTKNLGAYLS